MEESKPNITQPEDSRSQSRPLYPIPRKSRITIESQDSEEVEIDELLSLVFQLSNEHPGKKVEYWIRLET